MPTWNRTIRMAAERFAVKTAQGGNPVELAAAEIALLDEMPDVYLCGPPPMMDAALAALTAAGVPADQIHLERFAVSV